MSTISLWASLDTVDAALLPTRLSWLLSVQRGVRGLVVPPGSVSDEDELFLNAYSGRTVVQVNAENCARKGAAVALARNLDEGGAWMVESTFVPWLQSQRVSGEGRLLRHRTEVRVEELETWLTGNGYSRQYQVEAIGEWSRRGGVLDLWPPAEPSPIRLDFWGNEVERIRLFDANSQLSFGVREQIRIPALVDTGIGVHLWDLLQQQGKVELWQRTEAVTALQDRLIRQGEDPGTVAFSLKGLQTLPAPAQRPPEKEVQPLVLPPPLSGGNRWPLEPRFHALVRIVREGAVLLVSARSHRHRKALRELAEPYQLRIDFCEELPAVLEERHKGQVNCWVGPPLPALRIGADLVILDESDLVGGTGFRQRQPPPPRSRDLNLNNLQPGDAVVHEEYGIGIYEKLIRRTIDGALQEFLQIRYARDDRVLLPVDRIYMLDRMVAEGEARLDNLGSNRFSLRRQKAQQDAAQFAAELLHREARRSTVVALELNPPAEISATLEAGFPYTLTADQERSIEEIYADMMSGTPMDRLLVGDVGFGKTEVALRAVGLALENNLQAVVLAPTTILAYQHYRHFAERLRSVGATVAYVNRFRGADENQATMRAVALGKIDVLIGTHRVLQRDLHVPRLGLVVVDEEHKFGVSQKDRIRSLKNDAHRLAMSATPIPRSLNQAISGGRAISTITTPPPSRQSVDTQVVPVDETIIREVMEREMRRHGQVFVVTPRIEGLDDIADWITGMMPGARVGIGHGRLSGADMERLFLDFWEHNIDILISTNIVESGLDVVNANSMIIMQAHRFGLADLYQLRGRVGRAQRQGHCLLVVPTAERLTEGARGRIDAIERFSRLGSGYQVALYDLETRGAGEMLGKKQSGHLQAIGMAAYARLLQEAIAEIRHEDVVLVLEPEIRTWFSTALPVDLPLADNERLEIYRSLFSVRNRTDFAVRSSEVCDRFNIEAERLQPLEWLSVTRGYARQIGALVLDWNRRGLRIQIAPESHLDRSVLVSLAGAGGGVQLLPDALLLTWQETENPAVQWALIQPFLARLAAAVG